MAKGGGGETQQTTSEYRIPSWYQPQVQGLFNLAQNALSNTPKTVFGGDLYARMGGQQREAMGLGSGAAREMGNWWQPTYQLAQDTLQGRYLDINRNPVFSGYAEAATNPVYDRLLNRGGLLDQIQSQAITQGAYGGTAPETSRAIAATQASRDAADIRKMLAGEVYGMERGFQQTAPGMVQQAMAQRQAPIEALMQYGAMDQAERQAIADEAYAKWQESIQAPWRGINEYAAVLGSVPVGGMQVQTSPYQGPSPILGAIQGGMGGAATGASTGMMAGPWGALAGGIAGAGIGAYTGYQGNKRA